MFRKKKSFNLLELHTEIQINDMIFGDLLTIIQWAWTVGMLYS